MTDFGALGVRLLAPAFIAKLARTGLTEEEARAKVRHSIEEAAHTLSFVREADLASKRVLEAGAGLGILACTLHSKGFDVAALEPGETGFEENRSAALCVREELGAGFPLFECNIEELSPERHGCFGLIFSNNVLEHVADPERALAAMKRVLEPGGAMIHNCPNYTVPYEPHYRMMLVPAVPRLTRFLVPRRIREDACWRSLNFITHAAVRRAARNIGCDVTFEKELMYKAFKRLEADPLFGERQSGLPRRVYGVLKNLGLLGAVRHLPYQLSTPMVFSMRSVHGHS